MRFGPKPGTMTVYAKIEKDSVCFMKANGIIDGVGNSMLATHRSSYGEEPAGCVTQSLRTE